MSSAETRRNLWDSPIIQVPADIIINFLIILWKCLAIAIGCALIPIELIWRYLGPILELIWELTEDVLLLSWELLCFAGTLIGWLALQVAIYAFDFIGNVYRKWRKKNWTERWEIAMSAINFVATVVIPLIVLWNFFHVWIHLKPREVIECEKKTINRKYETPDMFKKPPLLCCRGAGVRF